MPRAGTSRRGARGGSGATCRRICTCECPSWADTGLSVADLKEKLGGNYELETVRRYITDLKRFRLVEQRGRGKEAQIQFSRFAVEAYLKTLRRWIAAFGEFEEKVKRLDMKQPHP
jgi:hypothetical protein